MKRTILLLALAVAACETAPPVADIPPPPDPDVTGPASVVSAPAPANRATMHERRLLLSINFTRDDYRVQPAAYPVLNNLAAALKDERMRGSLVEINGHTDTGGQLGYNMVLSFLRAQAVMRYLISRGVPPSMLRAQGFGPLQLLDQADQRNLANRRVEIVALSN